MRKTSKIVMGSLMGICGLMLASCGGDALSKSSAKSALEDQLVMFQDSSQVVRLVTGYYEENDEDSRFALKKLAAAGVIDYKVDLIIETRQGWYTRQYNHYFVTVNLTEEGKKYIVSDPVTEIVDKDMEVEVKEVAYPEDSVAPGDDLNSITPAVEAELEIPSDIDNSSSSSLSSRSSSSSGTSVSAAASDYEKALAKVHSEEYYLLSHNNKIVKIQKIYCPEEQEKQGLASCVYIYEHSDVTPFGRILNGVTEGDRVKSAAKFVKFIGSGWEVQEE